MSVQKKKGKKEQKKESQPALTCGICRFSWYKQPYRGQFQAMSLTSQSHEIGTWEDICTIGS